MAQLTEKEIKQIIQQQEKPSTQGTVQRPDKQVQVPNADKFHESFWKHRSSRW
ncbi:hypothetical protein [Acinetobacter indicus]|uniref:hypothetical protein n=1 Tax=Acinetobacter indicus TaxID=756892 RepID=UPI0032B3AAD6